MEEEIYDCFVVALNLQSPMCILHDQHCSVRPATSQDLVATVLHCTAPIWAVEVSMTLRICSRSLNIVFPKALESPSGQASLSKARRNSVSSRQGNPCYINTNCYVLRSRESSSFNRLQTRHVFVLFYLQ